MSTPKLGFYLKDADRGSCQHGNSADAYCHFLFLCTCSAGALSALAPFGLRDTHTALLQQIFGVGGVIRCYGTAGETRGVLLRSTDVA